VTAGRKAGAALRRARGCYGHLAGELGVAIADSLERRDLIRAGEGKRLALSPGGRVWFADKLGIEAEALRPGRHGIACRCLDWTERRPHLAGPLGTALLARLCEQGWLVRNAGSRVLRVTPPGAPALRDLFGLPAEAVPPA
jgi:hypothetical protein